MSTPGQQARRAAIQLILSRDIGRLKHASVVAESSLHIWTQVSTRLEPTIGATGVQVLFGRALHLASRKFPWLLVSVLDGDTVDLSRMLNGVSAAFQKRDPENAAEAAGELLATFAELLEALIGETLTERLLGAVWSPPQSNVENAACVTK